MIDDDDFVSDFEAFDEEESGGSAIGSCGLVVLFIAMMLLLFWMIGPYL